MLGISERASAGEIKRAYRRLARRYHPDSAGDAASHAQFQEICEAYRVLADPSTRARYDKERGIRQNVFQYDATGADSATEEVHAAYKRAATFAGRKHSQHGFEGPAGARYGNVAEAPSDLLVRKLKEFGKFTLSHLRGFGETKPRPRATSSERKSSANSTAERSYRLTINALESLHGAKREVAIDSAGAVEKMVEVQIPPGTADGEIIRVNIAKRGEEPRLISAVVQITPHPFLEREGNDLIIHVPLTFAEAIDGVDIEVPTPDGPHRLRIPSQVNGNIRENRIKVRGRGVMDTHSRQRGDLYIATYIVPPDRTSPALEQAGRAISDHYLVDVRSKLPKKL